MKFPLETFNYFKGKIKSFSTARIYNFFSDKFSRLRSSAKLPVPRIKTKLRGLPSRPTSFSIRESAIIIQGKLIRLSKKIRERGFSGTMIALQKKTVESWLEINSIGYSASMDDYEKRKLRIFNQLNFFGIITGVMVPISGIFDQTKLPALAWLLACAPAMISVLVLWLNHLRRYEEAIIVYFVLYPVVTSLVYLGGLNLGIELSFILYGILSVL